MVKWNDEMVKIHGNPCWSFFRDYLCWLARFWAGSRNFCLPPLSMLQFLSFAVSTQKRDFRICFTWDRSRLLSYFHFKSKGVSLSILTVVKTISWKILSWKHEILSNFSFLVVKDFHIGDSHRRIALRPCLRNQK